MTLFWINIIGTTLIFLFVGLTVHFKYQGKPPLAARNWLIASYPIVMLGVTLYTDPMLGGPWGGPTISNWAADRMLEFPSVALFMGVLVGHLTMRRRHVNYHSWALAISPVFALMAFDIYRHIHHDGTRYVLLFPVFVAIEGIPIGSYFWGQGDDGSPVA